MHAFGSAHKITKNQSTRQKHKHRNRNHHDQEAHEKEHDSRTDVETFRHGFANAATKSGGWNHDHRLGRDDVYGNGREARTVFEKALAAFESFDIAAHLG